ncbi:MAG: GMP synthase, partial [Ignavibacteriaceae bacterium]
LEKIWENNQKKDSQKKHVFFICHSFQMMARFFKFGDVTERDYKSFGVMPIQKTAEGEVDPLLKNLSNPYYAADIRRFQVLNPNKKVIDELGAEVLSVEIVPPNESHPPAIMAMRVSNEISGTQYHPEADPESMLYHFMKEEEKQQIIATYGEERYNQMIEHLRDPDKIRLTRKTILPTFLRESIKSLTLN